MTAPTQVPKANEVNMKDIFARYGEAMMQLKIATGNVQQIELQLQQIINSQQVQVQPSPVTT